MIHAHQKGLTYMLQRGSPQIISRLDMLLQKITDAYHQSPKAHNQKWSAEDQTLIDWIYQHWNSSLFPITGKIIWAKIERLVNEGPDGAAAKNRELQDGLLFIKKVIEQHESKQRGNQLDIREE